VSRQKRHQVLGHADGTNARSTTAVRDAEGLVQVQMADIGTDEPRRRQPHLGIEVGAVHVDLPTGLMDQGTDVLDGRLEHAMGARIGDHQARQRVAVLVDLGPEIRDVDVAVAIAGDRDDRHADHDRAGGIGAMGTGRDEADLAMTFSPGLVPGPDHQQPSVFPLGPRIGLE
jgi:hypothetical protein